MAVLSLSDAQLKAALKSALVEILEERADLLRDVLTEVVEDVALVRAIQEGESSGLVSRDEVFRAFDGVA